MTKNIIDFEKNRETLLHRRKEARINAIRRAFRDARKSDPSQKPDKKPPSPDKS